MLSLNSWDLEIKFSRFVGFSHIVKIPGVLGWKPRPREVKWLTPPIPKETTSQEQRRVEPIFSTLGKIPVSEKSLKILLFHSVSSDLHCDFYLLTFKRSTRDHKFQFSSFPNTFL